MVRKQYRNNTSVHVIWNNFYPSKRKLKQWYYHMLFALKPAHEELKTKLFIHPWIHIIFYWTPWLHFHYFSWKFACSLFPQGWNDYRASSSSSYTSTYLELPCEGPVSIIGLHFLSCARDNWAATCLPWAVTLGRDLAGWGRICLARSWRPTCLSGPF